jgi:hypothetical protein
VYEQLSFKRKDVPTSELRPSAVPNVYEGMHESTMITSGALQDDYLQPFHVNPSFSSDDADFNNPVYLDRSITNPKLQFSYNNGSTAS